MLCPHYLAFLGAVASAANCDQSIVVVVDADINDANRTTNLANARLGNQGCVKRRPKIIDPEIYRRHTDSKCPDQGITTSNIDETGDNAAVVLIEAVGALDGFLERHGNLNRLAFCIC